MTESQHVRWDETERVDLGFGWNILASLADAEDVAIAYNAKKSTVKAYQVVSCFVHVKSNERPRLSWITRATTHAGPALT